MTAQDEGTRSRRGRPLLWAVLRLKLAPVHSLFKMRYYIIHKQVSGAIKIALGVKALFYSAARRGVRVRAGAGEDDRDRFGVFMHGVGILIFGSCASPKIRRRRKRQFVFTFLLYMQRNVNLLKTLHFRISCTKPMRTTLSPASTSYLMRNSRAHRRIDRRTQIHISLPRE